MSQKIISYKTLFEAQAAAGTSPVFDIRDHDFVTVSIATTGSANLTVKFQGSAKQVAPDFAAAQTFANHWDYLDATDLEDGASVDGDTGFAVTGTDDVRLFRIDVRNLSWFAATVTARSAGSVSAEARAYQTV